MATESLQQRRAAPPPGRPDGRAVAQRAVRDVLAGALGGAIGVASFGLGLGPIAVGAAAGAALLALLERDRLAGKVSPDNGQ